MSDELLFDTLRKIESGDLAAKDPKLGLLIRVSLVFGIMMLGLFALAPVVKIGTVFNAVLVVVTMCFIGVTASCAIAGLRKEIKSRKRRVY